MSVDCDVDKTSDDVGDANESDVRTSIHKSHLLKTYR